jgi:hypothetical protein
MLFYQSYHYQAPLVPVNLSHMRLMLHSEKKYNSRLRDIETLRIVLGTVDTKSTIKAIEHYAK